MRRQLVGLAHRASSAAACCHPRAPALAPAAAVWARGASFDYGPAPEEGPESKPQGGQAGGQTVEGAKREGGQGPIPKASYEDEQKTGGTQQKGEASSYRPPHQTGGEGKAMQPPESKHYDDTD